MELQRERVTQTPRDSASVVVVRPHPDKVLEVLLLRRDPNLPLLGGAHVFPGGKTEPSDAQVLQHLPQEEQIQLSQSLAEPELTQAQALALYAAALREAQEECGLTLQAHHLVPWSRWITPELPSLMNRRFDTRFFLACMPPDQSLTLDQREVVQAVWCGPEEALHAYWSGELQLAPPQLLTLTDFLAWPSLQKLWDYAQGRAPVCIRPEPFDDDAGLRHICYPGDPLHSEPTRRMAGPTRLVYRQGRFEPLTGLHEFLTKHAP